MGAFGVGVAVVALAFGLFAVALFGEPVPRIAKRRRTRAQAEARQPFAQTAAHTISTAVDAMLKKRGWAPLSASELEMADIEMPVGLVVSWILSGSFLALLVGWLFSGPLGGVFLAFFVPVGAKLVFKRRAAKRRKAFAGQLDYTLRIVSSALRAGHSLPTALASVAADSNAPMSEEFTRVISENRLGRDLVEALHACAERMKNEDLEWFTGSVAVQRDSGGNLTDIIMTVSETIRERSALRQKIAAYSAEGRMSAWVLMALPVALAVIYQVMRPGYMDPMVVTTIGRLLSVLCVALYVGGYFWMRSIINFKV